MKYTKEMLLREAKSWENFNDHRRRRYGIRFGDIVTYSPFNLKEEMLEIVGFDADNNAAYAIPFNFDPKRFTQVRKVVAEWCAIKHKVEDRKDGEKFWRIQEGTHSLE